MHQSNLDHYRGTTCSEEGLTQDLLDDRIAAYPTGDIRLDRTNWVAAASLLGAFAAQLDRGTVSRRGFPSLCT